MPNDPWLNGTLPRYYQAASVRGPEICRDSAACNVKQISSSLNARAKFLTVGSIAGEDRREKRGDSLLVLPTID